MAENKSKSTGDDYRVSTREDGKWAVTREGAERASDIFDTQEEAIERGKELAKKAHVDLTVQDRHGQTRSKDSYGNDPRSRRDTEH